MVFQKPNPFPAMSIYDNVASGLKLAGIKVGRTRTRWSRSACAGPDCGTRSSGRLRRPGGGAVRRPAAAAVHRPRRWPSRPDVLLMDEPCSALDPTSTRRIEETIAELREPGDDRHRHPQHAAGAAGVAATARSSWPRTRRPGTSWRRGRPEQMFELAQGPADRRLRQRPLRLTPRARAGSGQVTAAQGGSGAAAPGGPRLGIRRNCRPREESR